MPRPKPPARQLKARLPNDMLSAAARLPLAELVPSGLLRAVCDALVSHVYSVVRKTPLVAHASLVGHHPHRGHQELTLLHYPQRTAGDCLAQATVCVHPVGCRDLNASVETGDGLWKPLGAGDVFLSLYKEGATPGSAHRVRWTSREAAVPCVCLRVLMIAA